MPSSRLVVAAVLTISMAGAAALEVLRAHQDQSPTVFVVETVKGTFEIEVYPDDAPKSVAHVTALVQKNFYRGLRVHWAEPGVVQFGDPNTRDMTKKDQWGTGGSRTSVGVAETSSRRFVRGTVGLAYRPTQPPSAADSQMFILTRPNPELNGKYAVIGHVTSGLDVIDELAVDDRIINITIKEGLR